MKNLFATVISMLAVIGLNAEPTLSGDARTAIFSEELAPLLVSRVCYRPPERIVSYWLPSLSDLPNAEETTEKFLRERVLHEECPEWKWPHYIRQVAGVVIDGRKFVFVSYYYAGSADAWAQKESWRIEERKRRGEQPSVDWWRSEPLYIIDGGYRYFRVLYDPETKQFVWYEQNGDA